MLKPEEIAKRLSAFLVEDADDNDHFALGERLLKLPSRLSSIGLGVLAYDDKGAKLEGGWRGNDKARQRRAKAVDAFDKLAAVDRKAIFKAIVPKLASHLEDVWQYLKRQPYQIGQARKAFRAPRHPDLTKHSRVRWLDTFSRMVGCYECSSIDAPWLAQWAPHAFKEECGHIAPILSVAIDRDDANGKEVFDILYRSVTREHEIGVIGHHAIAAFLGASNPEGWALMEKTLLAAQRQEGLRQSIVECLDLAHPDACKRMIRVIIDNNLLRFSSVARSVNVWLGQLWDAASTKVLNDNVEQILKYLESTTEREKGLKDSDAENVYRALWCEGFYDAMASIPKAVGLQKSKSDEHRFVAAWYLTILGLNTATRANSEAIDDPNLQVALTAAVRTHGIDNAYESKLNDKEDGDADGGDKKRFEQLVKLIERIPDRPTTLKPLLWPWTARKIQRSDLALPLLDALGQRPPTDMLPYLPYMQAYQQTQVVWMLSKQKKWDAGTREALLKLCGSATADVRDAAFTALAAQKLQDNEVQLFEGFLSRKPVDIRKNIFEALFALEDERAIASATRLIDAKDANQRLGGLELLRRLAEADRFRSDCQKLVQQYRQKSKKRSAEEEAQISAIESSGVSVVTLENALGLFDPQELTKVAIPKKKSLTPQSKPARDLIAALDALVHQHRKATFIADGYRGPHEVVLGSADESDLPCLNLSRPLEPQLKKLPLWDVWSEWYNARPSNLRDRDGLELCRAKFMCELQSDWDFDDLVSWCKSGQNRAMAESILGPVGYYKLKYQEVVFQIIDWLWAVHAPKPWLDFVFDGAENAIASVSDELKNSVLPGQLIKYKGFWEGDYVSWRELPPFKIWFTLAEKLMPPGNQEWPAAIVRRYWELARFRDRPLPGATRKRVPLTLLHHAAKQNLPNREDVIDHFLGKREQEDLIEYDFHDLAWLTEPRNETEISKANLPANWIAWTDEMQSRILDVELSRGEAPTIATRPALKLRSIYGIDNFFRILKVIGHTPFKKDSSFWGDNRLSRPVVLTSLLRACHPGAKDTHKAFAKHVDQAIADGLCNEQRLLELGFLAPQWTKYIEAYLDWNGFSEALYWFIAHMDPKWESDANQNAASSEGLSDDDDFDGMDDTSESALPQREKLTAWQRLVLERTPLTKEQRYEGAVDIAWFQRTWDQLGEKRWTIMAQSARYATNSAQAKKAQFLADTLLGKVTRKELMEGIEKRKLKDNVRLLGLLPLEQGAKRDRDLQERYDALLAYREYARGLSSLTRPAAMRTSEIGSQNLARLAGYPDPLRLEWAMEAESVADLAKGPLRVTKGGITVTLSIDDQAAPQIQIEKDKKPIKTLPTVLRRKHGLTYIWDRAAELKKKTARIKSSLESAMCRGDIITADELVHLSGHAMLAPLVARLIFIGDGIAGYPDKNGKVLRDHQGKFEPIKRGEQLRIAHPCDLFKRGDWDKWQKDCFQAERVQPFKQVFRELYVVSPQEKKDGSQSQRFAGHQVQPAQAMALWGNRGWNTQDGVFKVFHDSAIVASVGFLYGGGTGLEIEGWTLGNVSFRLRDESQPLPLTKVDPRIFSEVMRDMDLVASVAHCGEVDPEASASTVQMRASLIREMCTLLGLKNVKINGSHAIISGHYAEYTLHLGSGSVHQMPGGALCIIPIHSQHRGRIFLPFADDDPRTAELVSKVLLLARDEEIQDPKILEQLGAPIELKPIKAVAEAVAATAKGGATKKKSSAASASTTSTSGTGPRRLEFSDGSSNKFWEIEINGNDVTTRWGRIGTDGQSKTKSFSSPADAQKEYDKLLKEKVSKGYQ